MQYLVFCLLHITMLFTPGRAGVKQCNSTVSSLYVRKGQEKRLQPTEGLLAALASKQSDEYMLRRWDGVLGTFDTHLDWMYQHARRFTDPGTPGFRGYGTHSGIQYEINDELTKIGGGDGYFRLSGEIDIPPEGLIAQVMDSDALGELDPTVMYLNFLHRYSADPRSRMCLWIAAPGFPFQWRMYALSIPEELPDTPSLAIRAVDRYWAYRLEPINDGKRTKLTLICQTNLFGWMPQFLVNLKIGEVLADYVRSAEERGKAIMSQPSAEEGAFDWVSA